MRDVRDKFINKLNPPTSTLVQVSKLVREDLLIEIDATVTIHKKDKKKTMRKEMIQKTTLSALIVFLFAACSHFFCNLGFIRKLQPRNSTKDPQVLQYIFKAISFSKISLPFAKAE